MAKLQKGVNDLKTWCSLNGEFGRQLMQEWTGQCEDGRIYKIDEVAKASNKKFKWKCSKGHEWFNAVVHRTGQKHGCPCCSNVVRSDKVSKAKLQKGVNDLKTWCLSNGDWGQQLIQEWTGELEDGSHCQMDAVAKASPKKVKWKCNRGHEWYAAISNRTNRKSGCPYCNNNNGTSYPEQFMHHCFKQLYPSTVNRCRVLKSPQNPQGIEFDIGIAELRLVIEYSPTFWHDGNQERDNYKKEICKKAGVRLIQIIEDSYGELDHCIEDDYICFKMDSTMQDEILAYIVDHILKSLGRSISEIDIETAKKNAWEYSRGKIEYEKSLEYMYPELAKEWHPTLNDELKPGEITHGSHAKVYWVCPICSYGSKGEWFTAVNSRTNTKTGCSRCGYNWSDGTKHKFGSKLVNKGVDDLQSQFPNLAKEWHPTLNTNLNSDEVKCGSTKKVYWICPKCNHGANGEWYSTVNQRTYQKSGCQKCGYNWSDGKIHKTGSTVVNKGVNDLQSQHPELAKEWHPTLNADLKPYEIKCGSNKSVYWQCQKCSYGSNGEWQAPPVRRTAKGRETGCPNCGYNWSDGRIHKRGVAGTGVNDLQSQFPDLAKEWHPTLNGNLKPDQTTCGSNAKVYWQCPKCNHGVTGEWYTTVNKRTYHKAGCPRCGHNWHKAQQGPTTKVQGKYKQL